MPAMKLSLLLSVFLVLASCASKHDKKLDTAMAETPHVASHAEANQNVNEIINSSTHLTDVQKTQLLSLHEKTDIELAKLNQEALKFHGILAAEYGKEKRSMREIKTIKKRMIKNSKKRLDIIFGSMEQADKILGHDKSDRNVSVMNSLFIERVHRNNNY